MKHRTSFSHRTRWWRFLTIWKSLKIERWLVKWSRNNCSVFGKLAHQMVHQCNAFLLRPYHWRSTKLWFLMSRSISSGERLGTLEMALILLKPGLLLAQSLCTIKFTCGRMIEPESPYHQMRVQCSAPNRCCWHFLTNIYYRMPGLCHSDRHLHWL